jgi:hypothetical protein
MTLLCLIAYYHNSYMLIHANKPRRPGKKVKSKMSGIIKQVY